MSVLTDRERQILGDLSRIRHGHESGCACSAQAREVADHVRRECSDLDDVTLARALLAAAAPLSFFAARADVSGRELAGALSAAAVDLASLHLD